ncbi:hypothetical protein MBLNU459_g6413t1 [Dothideomycetes sp. NU459]
MPAHASEQPVVILDSDEGCDASDLDIRKPGAKEVGLLGCLDDSNSSGASPDRTKKRNRVPEGERIAFSDDGEDDDHAYEKFKRRKTDQRKKTAARTRKARLAASESSIVGRKPKTAIKLKDDQPARLVKHDTYGTDSDSDEAAETALPQFLKDRRSRWEIHHGDLGVAGLHLPPSYDDVDFSDDERLQALDERPVFPGEPYAKYQDVELRYSAGIIPAPIAQRLRPYQIKGAEFLHELFVFQKGGILGDDMGLGKTIQVIAFLTAAFGKTADERDAKRMRKMRRRGEWYPKVLIICPGGLMANWRAELERWGWWQVDLYHGTPSDREAVLSSAKAGNLEIMITTYTTYRNNREDINLVEWDCVIADECHIIKDKTRQTTKAMNEVNALCRIGLTGTAIQNKYDEMWTILNWTNPGRLGPISSWKASISDPLKLGQSHDATMAQLAKARKTAKKLVDNLLPNFFLRRMKSLIADQLPKKSDRVVFCQLTERQTEAYENLVNSELIDYIRRSSEICDCNSGKKRGWCCYVEIPGHGKWQHHVFPCLVTLQHLSNHLAMLIPSSDDNRDRQEKDTETLQIALPDDWKALYRQRDSVANYANQDFCGKWRVLKRLLKFWHSNGDKVLVFSHSVRLLKMLKWLFDTTTDYSVSFLVGSMTYEDRATEVDQFNANPTQFVFLISTKAGGVGLNIVSANKVVVFDPNWNPAWDLQAQDRAYRIGQTRDVEVFRLVSAGTVEEIVYARQIYKQQQANIAYNASLERRYFKGVQDQKDKKGEIFGLVNLFSFQGDNIVLQDILNKTNIAESKAGVSVVGLDTSQDGDDDTHVGENEDAALSQLAALLTGDEKAARRFDQEKTQKKFDAVQAILAGAGVQYTHENSEVIGSSRMEAKLSKRAEAAGNDVDLSNEYVFAKSQSLYNPIGLEKGVNDHIEAENKEDSDEETIRYQWNPPEQVRRRQFCSIAKEYGYNDATEFALVVEGWTQSQRRDCLDKFYRDRKLKLAKFA